MTYNKIGRVTNDGLYLKTWKWVILEDTAQLKTSKLPHVNTFEHWRSQLDPGEGYAVLGAYNLLPSQELHRFTAVLKFIWHKDVSLKISLFTWQLLHNWLSTKDNLVRHDIIPLESQLCISGCGNVETTQHFFLSCNIFISIWHLVHTWIGFYLVNPPYVSDYFVQFAYSSFVSNAWRFFMHLIWLSCAWVLWIERKNKLFKKIRKNQPLNF